MTYNSPHFIPLSLILFLIALTIFLSIEYSILLLGILAIINGLVAIKSKKLRFITRELKVDSTKGTEAVFGGIYGMIVGLMFVLIALDILFEGAIRKYFMNL